MNYGGQTEWIQIRSSLIGATLFVCTYISHIYSRRHKQMTFSGKYFTVFKGLNLQQEVGCNDKVVHLNEWVQCILLFSVGHDTKYLENGRYFYCGSFMFFFYLVFAMPSYASIFVCLVITCQERADLLVPVCGVYCEFASLSLVSWVRCGT